VKFAWGIGEFTTPTAAPAPMAGVTDVLDTVASRRMMPMLNHSPFQCVARATGRRAWLIFLALLPAAVPLLATTPFVMSHPLGVWTGLLLLSVVMWKLLDAS
jgi:hypothetical protein